MEQVNTISKLISQDQESIANHYNFIAELYDEYAEFDIEEISDEDEPSDKEKEPEEEEAIVQEVIIEPREYTEFSVSQAYSQEASKFNKEWNQKYWANNINDSPSMLEHFNIFKAFLVFIDTSLS